MVAVKSGEIDELVARRNLKAAAVLVYGPDIGLVAERAKRIAQNGVDDPGDPFQLVKMDGDAIASDPLRLADEANTIGLFGGRRAIWIKPTSRNLVPALTPILALPPQDALLVIEAGDLAKSSPLRTLCERSPLALAIPCYADGPRELAALVDAAISAAKLSIEPDARETLLGLLGGDRMASRSELEKLTLYARGQGRISEDDVLAAVGDISSTAVDALVDTAFAGDLSGADQALARLKSEGMDSGVIVGFLLRHALALGHNRPAIDHGQPAGAAVERMRVHFRRKAAVERHLRLWTMPEIVRIIRLCGEAIGETRKRPALAAQAMEKTIWSIGAAARRARPR